MGEMHASLLLNAIHYPRTCQQAEDAAAKENASLDESCHLFDPQTVRFDFPKSIVNPRRGGHFVVRITHIFNGSIDTHHYHEYISTSCILLRCTDFQLAHASHISFPMLLMSVCKTGRNV